MYNQVIAKKVIRILEAEVAGKFASLMARVRDGAEAVIENDARPVAILRTAEPVRGRLISECIALAKAHKEETGRAPNLAPDFAVDIEQIVNNRKPWNALQWE